MIYRHLETLQEKLMHEPTALDCFLPMKYQKRTYLLVFSLRLRLKEIPALAECNLSVRRKMFTKFIYIITTNRCVFLKKRRIKYKNKFTSESAVGINLGSSSSGGAGAQSACGIWQTLFCD